MQGNLYEILIEADFSCFYNETPYLLPAISDPNAVLNDTVVLDVQLKTEDSASSTSAGDEVRSISLCIEKANLIGSFDFASCINLSIILRSRSLFEEMYCEERRVCYAARAKLM